MKRIPLLLFLTFCSISRILFAQDNGVLTGDIQLNQNFFSLDSNILTPPIPPQYSQQLSSTEAWANFNYRYKGFSAGVRFDLFNNSGLRNPFIAFNGQGLGFWYLRKEIENLTITAGYFYDQFGSGIAFRAYEGRGQNLDYAIQGVHLKYKLNDNWTAKGFTGKQKFLFGTYDPIIKGVNIEGYIPKENLAISPGFSVVNRTLDNNSINLLVNSINSAPLEERFVPKYNAFIYSAYNTFSYKKFSLFAELAYKTREGVLDRDGKLVNKDGTVLFGTATYSTKGFGIVAQYKRTEFFEFRTSAFEILNDGLLTFISPMARFNTYRLTSRYAPATQLIGEQAFQFDTDFTFLKKQSGTANFSDIRDLAGNRLYQEFYLETKLKINKKSDMKLGIQRQVYNQEVYEFKPDAPLVKTVTPFAEYTYKISRKKSIRAEVSHMWTEEDLGDWMWALVEYNIAPKYSFSIMDMYNYGNKDADKRIHYWTAFGAINLGKNRFTGGYVRQVQGIICTGGVCRVEPAFNGVRATYTAVF